LTQNFNLCAPPWYGLDATKVGALKSKSNGRPETSQETAKKQVHFFLIKRPQAVKRDTAKCWVIHRNRLRETRSKTLRNILLYPPDGRQKVLERKQSLGTSGFF
jgi:Zn-finger protein